MRTLNRPMFRMGGPIKEGVMHGIREPKNMGGRMLLVGQHPKELRDKSGREGAMLGQYDADTLANRAGLRAQMLQGGYENAQRAAQQAFQQQGTLGAGQMGLSNFQRTGLGADVGALGQLGSLRQGITGAQLQADQQAAQTAAYEPYGRLSQYGTGITGLAGGMAPMQYQAPQAQSPWASALSTALGIGGLYGQIYNKRV